MLNYQKNEAIVIIKNKDKLCGIYSMLALLHRKGHNPNRVSNYRQHLHGEKLKGIDLTDGFEVDGVEKVEQSNYKRI